MSSPKPVGRKRKPPHKIHILSWVLSLDKNGYIPCHLKNCTFMASTLDEMVTHYHLTNCLKQFPFTCDDCKLSTDLKEKLIMHKVFVHSYKPTQQEQKDLSIFLDIKREISPNLRLGWQLYLKNKGYLKCLFKPCSLVLDSLEEMEYHYLHNCQEELWPLSISECKFCHGKFDCGARMTSHVQMFHCNEAEEVRSYKSYHPVRELAPLWAQHILTSKQAACPVPHCKFISNNVLLLERHYSMCNGKMHNTYVVCPFCQCWLQNEIKLREHMRCLHKNQPENRRFEKVIGQTNTDGKDQRLSDILNDLLPKPVVKKYITNNATTSTTDGPDSSHIFSSEESIHKTSIKPVFNRRRSINNRSIDCLENENDISEIQFSQDAMNMKRLFVEPSVEGSPCLVTEEELESKPNQLHFSNIYRKSKVRGVFPASGHTLAPRPPSTSLEEVVNNLQDQATSTPLQIKVDKMECKVTVNIPTIQVTKQETFPKNVDALYEVLRNDSFKLLETVSNRISPRCDVKRTFDPYEKPICPLKFSVKKNGRNSLEENEIFSNVKNESDLSFEVSDPVSKESIEVSEDHEEDNSIIKTQTIPVHNITIKEVVSNTKVSDHDLNKEEGIGITPVSVHDLNKENEETNVSVHSFNMDEEITSDAQVSVHDSSEEDAHIHSQVSIHDLTKGGEEEGRGFTSDPQICSNDFYTKVGVAREPDSLHEFSEVTNATNDYAHNLILEVNSKAHKNLSHQNMSLLSTAKSNADLGDIVQSIEDNIMYDLKCDNETIETKPSLVNNSQSMKSISLKSSPVKGTGILRRSCRGRSKSLSAISGNNLISEEGEFNGFDLSKEWNEKYQRYLIERQKLLKVLAEFSGSKEIINAKRRRTKSLCLLSEEISKRESHLFNKKNIEKNAKENVQKVIRENPENFNLFEDDSSILKSSNLLIETRTLDTESSSIIDEQESYINQEEATCQEENINSEKNISEKHFFIRNKNTNKGSSCLNNESHMIDAPADPLDICSQANLEDENHRNHKLLQDKHEDWKIDKSSGDNSDLDDNSGCQETSTNSFNDKDFDQEKCNTIGGVRLFCDEECINEENKRKPYYHEESTEQVILEYREKLALEALQKDKYIQRDDLATKSFVSDSCFSISVDTSFQESNVSMPPKTCYITKTNENKTTNIKPKIKGKPKWSIPSDNDLSSEFKSPKMASLVNASFEGSCSTEASDIRISRALHPLQDVRASNAIILLKGQEEGSVSCLSVESDHFTSSTRVTSNTSDLVHTLNENVGPKETRVIRKGIIPTATINNVSPNSVSRKRGRPKSYISPPNNTTSHISTSVRTKYCKISNKVKFDSNSLDSDTYEEQTLEHNHTQFSKPGSCDNSREGSDPIDDNREKSSNTTLKMRGRPRKSVPNETCNPPTSSDNFSPAPESMKAFPGDFTSRNTEASAASATSNPVDDIGDKSCSTTPKKRGRPRKSVSNESCNPTAPSDKFLPAPESTNAFPGDFTSQNTEASGTSDTSNPVDDIGEKSSNTSPKKRGRPRKSVSNESCNPTAPSDKFLPAPESTNAFPGDFTSQNTEASGTSDTSNPVDDIGEKSSNTSPKKRGRPRKSVSNESCNPTAPSDKFLPAPESTNAFPGDFTSQNTEASGTSDTSNPVDDIGEKSSNTSPKKRGRPRKSVSNESCNPTAPSDKFLPAPESTNAFPGDFTSQNTEASVTSDTSNPVDDIGEKSSNTTLKRRGRPRKSVPNESCHPTTTDNFSPAPESMKAFPGDFRNSEASGTSDGFITVDDIREISSSTTIKKRGRPRKRVSNECCHPTTPDNFLPAPESTNAFPGDFISQNTEASVISDGSNTVNYIIEKSSSTTLKKRGRPRKSVSNESSIPTTTSDNFSLAQESMNTSSINFAFQNTEASGTSDASNSVDYIIEKSSNNTPKKRGGTRKGVSNESCHPTTPSDNFSPAPESTKAFPGGDFISRITEASVTSDGSNTVDDIREKSSSTTLKNRGRPRKRVSNESCHPTTPSDNFSPAPESTNAFPGDFISQNTKASVTSDGSNNVDDIIEKSSSYYTQEEWNHLATKLKKRGRPRKSVSNESCLPTTPSDKISPAQESTNAFPGDFISPNTEASGTFDASNRIDDMGDESSSTTLKNRGRPRKSFSDKSCNSTAPSNNVSLIRGVFTSQNTEAPGISDASNRVDGRGNILPNAVLQNHRRPNKFVSNESCNGTSPCNNLLSTPASTNSVLIDFTSQNADDPVTSDASNYVDDITDISRDNQNGKEKKLGMPTEECLHRVEDSYEPSHDTPSNSFELLMKSNSEVACVRRPVTKSQSQSIIVTRKRRLEKDVSAEKSLFSSSSLNSFSKSINAHTSQETSNIGTLTVTYSPEGTKESNELAKRRWPRNASSVITSDRESMVYLDSEINANNVKKVEKTQDTSEKRHSRCLKKTLFIGPIEDNLLKMRKEIIKNVSNSDRNSIDSMYFRPSVADIVSHSTPKRPGRPRKVILELGSNEALDKSREEENNLQPLKRRKVKNGPSNDEDLLQFKMKEEVEKETSLTDYNEFEDMENLKNNDMNSTLENFNPAVTFSRSERYKRRLLENHQKDLCEQKPKRKPLRKSSDTPDNGNRRVTSGRIEVWTVLEHPEKEVTCAVCGESMTAISYQKDHLKEHNFMAWLVGEEPWPLENEDCMTNVLTRAKKRFPDFEFTCEFCSEQRKSARGFVTHREACKNGRKSSTNLTTEDSLGIPEGTPSEIKKIPEILSNSALLQSSAERYSSYQHLKEDVDTPLTDRQIRKRILSGRIDATTKLKEPNKQVKCAVCGETMIARVYQKKHLLKHNFIAWLEGEEPLPLDDPECLTNVLQRGKLKNPRFVFTCDICNEQKKSSLGFLSHRQFCGRSVEEKKNLLVSCEYCGRVMMPFSIPQHIYQVHRNVQAPHDEVNVVSTPRKAAARCLDIISAAKDDLMDIKDVKCPKDEKLGESDDLSVLYGYTYRKPSKNLTTVWKHQESRGGPVACSAPKCNFTCSTYPEILSHFKACPFNLSCFSCLKCHYTSKNVEIMKEHVQNCVNSVSDQSEDETNDFNVIPYFKNEEFDYPDRSKLVFFKPALSWTKNLYEDILSKETVFVNYEEVWEKVEESSNFIPEEKKSLPFCYNTSKWSELALFQGKIDNGGKEGISYTGGPIWGLAWSPSAGPQYLAVASQRSMETHFQVGSTYNGPGLIQIWALGNLNNSVEGKLEKLEFEFGLCHEGGGCWDLAWCPGGGETESRMGLLAVATTSGTIPIFPVPKPHTLPLHETKYFKVKPAIKLELPSNEKWQCSAISWSKKKPHRMIVAGFVNGVIGVWDLSSSSSLLWATPDSLCAHKVFQAHNSFITGICLSPENEEFLVSTGFDKSLKFWDLRDTTMPQSVTSRGLPTGVDWLRHWMMATTSFDVAYTLSNSTVSLSSLGGYSQQTLPIANINSTSWDVSCNDWLNALAACYDNGQVLVCFPVKHHILLQNKERKRYSKVILQSSLQEYPTEDSGLQSNLNQSKQSASSTLYSESSRKYGLCIQTDIKILPVGSNDLLIENTNEGPIEMYPLTSINRVSWSPNKENFTYLASGYQSGFLVVTKLSFPKKEQNLIDSLNSNR